MQRIVSLGIGLVAAVLLLPVNVCGQTQGQGLEVDNFTTLQVLVEELNPAATAIGLSAERLRGKVEQRLRQAGISPPGSSPACYLYVNVNVAGGAFNVHVAFYRMVYYKARGAQFYTLADVWAKSAAGIHGGNGEYVQRYLDGIMDGFLGEFLKANQGT